MDNNPSTKQYRAHLSYPAILLGMAVLIASSLLALGHSHTRDAIAAREAEDLQNSLAQVIDSSLYDNDLPASLLILDVGAEEPVTVYRAILNGELTAFAYQMVTAEGYGGAIRLLLGIDREGKILGVRVLSHAETPGLGDKVEIAKSGWIQGFDGLSLDFPTADKWSVKKDGGHFDQFTGATITPRAVVGAVKQGLELFGQHKESLLVPLKKTTGSETESGLSSTETGGGKP